MVNNPNHIGPVIRRIREERGLSLNYVAAEAGLESSSLSKFERALQDNLPSDRLASVARTLETPLSRIYAEAEGHTARDLKAYEALMRLPEDEKDAYFRLLVRPQAQRQ